MNRSICSLAALGMASLLGACALPLPPTDEGVMARQAVADVGPADRAVAYGVVTHVERVVDGPGRSASGAGALIGGVIGAAIGREVGRDVGPAIGREGPRGGGRDRGPDAGRGGYPDSGHPGSRGGSQSGDRDDGRDDRRPGGGHGGHGDRGTGRGGPERLDGRDLGTLIGALAGAWLGHEIERQSGERREILRVDVQLDQGGRRPFDLSPGEDLRVGDRVRIEGQRLVRL